MSNNNGQLAEPFIDPSKFDLAAVEIRRLACTTDFHTVFATGSANRREFCLEASADHTVIRPAHLSDDVFGAGHCYFDDKSALKKLEFPSDRTARRRLLFSDENVWHSELFYCGIHEVSLTQDESGAIRPAFTMALLSRQGYMKLGLHAIELQLACREVVRRSQELALNAPTIGLKYRTDPLFDRRRELKDLILDFSPAERASELGADQVMIPQVIAGSFIGTMGQYLDNLYGNLADKAGMTYCDRINEVLRAMIRYAENRDIGPLLPRDLAEYAGLIPMQEE